MVFGAFDTFVQNLKSHLIQFLIIVSLSSLSPPKRRLSQTSNRLRLRATRLQEMASLFVGVPNSHLRRAYDGWHRWDYGQDNAWTQSYKVTQSCKSILYWLSHSYQLWLSKQNWYMFFFPREMQVMCTFLTWCHPYSRCPKARSKLTKDLDRSRLCSLTGFRRQWPVGATRKITRVTSKKVQRWDCKKQTNPLQVRKIHSFLICFCCTNQNGPNSEHCFVFRIGSTWLSGPCPRVWSSLLWLSARAPGDRVWIPRIHGSWLVRSWNLKSEDIWRSSMIFFRCFVHVTSCNRCNLHQDAFPLADGTFSGASTTSVDARTRWASMCKEWSLTSVASCCISRVSAGFSRFQQESWWYLMLMLILRNLCAVCANFLFLDPALGHLKRCQEQN